MVSTKAVLKAARRGDIAVIAQWHDEGGQVDQPLNGAGDVRFDHNSPHVSMVRILICSLEPPNRGRSPWPS